MMDRLAERNAVRNGDELWFYNSKDNTAAHAQLPADAAGRHADGPGAAATPEDLADKLLAKLDASTDVTVGPDVQIAGRAAYNLVLTPTTDATLVDSVAIAVDGESGLPLGVEVKARDRPSRPSAWPIRASPLRPRMPPSSTSPRRPGPPWRKSRCRTTKPPRPAAVGRRRGRSCEAAHRHRHGLGHGARIPRQAPAARTRRSGRHPVRPRRPAGAGRRRRPGRPAACRRRW